MLRRRQRRTAGWTKRTFCPRWHRTCGPTCSSLWGICPRRVCAPSPTPRACPPPPSASRSACALSARASLRHSSVRRAARRPVGLRLLMRGAAATAAQRNMSMARRVSSSPWTRALSLVGVPRPRPRSARHRGSLTWAHARPPPRPALLHRRPGRAYPRRDAAVRAHGDGDAMGNAADPACAQVVCGRQARGPQRDPRRPVHVRSPSRHCRPWPHTLSAGAVDTRDHPALFAETLRATQATWLVGLGAGDMDGAASKDGHGRTAH
jgi:hypothetical protein